MTDKITIENMKKVPLDEIAAYLPYCLLVKIKGLKHPAPLSGIIYDHTAICDFESGESDYPMEDIRPLVIPLDELTKEDLMAMDCSTHALGRNFIIYSVQDKSISIKDYHYLLSRHYDVNGWIERGLGVNKLTVKI